KAAGITFSESQIVVSNAATSYNALTKQAGEGGEVTFGWASNEDNIAKENLEVNGENYKYLATAYVLVPGGDTQQLSDLTMEIKTGLNENITLNVPNAPVQRNYRTNVLGNLLTNQAEFTVVVDPIYSGNNNLVEKNYTAGGSKSLKAVLDEISADNTLFQAVINLENDVTWETGAGHGSTPFIAEGATVSNVIINGNGNTLTATGSGVGSIRMANGGTLILNDLNVVDESKSYDEGSWEFTYLEFAGKLECNNVTFNSGISLDTDNGTTLETAAKFTKCNFHSPNSSEYSVWFSNGSAEFEGCTFTGTRALKVHECYGTVIETVTVNNCLFQDISKKPGVVIGIIVAPGAQGTYGSSTWTKPATAPVTSIALTNNTFAGCQKADTECASYKDYVYESDTDVTTFNFKEENNTIAETATSFATAVAAAKDGDVITFVGTVKMPGFSGKTLTFVGGDETAVIDLTSAVGLQNANVNFKNLTVDRTANTNYTGFQHTAVVSYEDCVIKGKIFLYGAKETFKNCTFEQTAVDYNVWTYGANEVVFDDCTFNCAGKSVLIYDENSAHVETVTFNNCTLNASAPANDGKAAIEIGCSHLVTGWYTIKINNTDANGFDLGSVSKNSLWNVKNGDRATVLVDGDDVINTIEIGTKAELIAFANDVNVNGNGYYGKTVVLTADIDLEGMEWEPIGQTGGNGVATYFQGTFDGGGHTISNLKISQNNTYVAGNYASGLFGFVDAADANIKNLTIDGADVTGTHWTAVIAGYLTGKVENCHVKNAKVVCNHVNGEACGDKAGTIVGYVNSGIVKSSTAADCTVAAGRDAGQLVGCAKETQVESASCTATNVVVSATEGCTGANVRNELIGRLNY
ncbi:MAG: hypothetical protein IJ328_06530, partial [Muribaculaceae bacterium]|nr:hypothetical protein [Muribaculaceae bacterium]